MGDDDNGDNDDDSEGDRAVIAQSPIEDVKGE